MLQLCFVILPSMGAKWKFDPFGEDLVELGEDSGHKLLVELLLEVFACCFGVEEGLQACYKCLIERDLKNERHLVVKFDGCRTSHCDTDLG